MVRRAALLLAGVIASAAAAAPPQDTLVANALASISRHALFQPGIDQLAATATETLAQIAPLPARCDRPVATMDALVARINCATAALPHDQRAAGQVDIIQALLRRLDRRNDLILPGHPIFRPVDPGTDAGIGLVLEQDGLSLRVVRTLATSPARAAGISPGERLITIDGQPQEGRAAAAVMADLIGTAGSRIMLGLAGPAGQRSLTLTRAAPGPALNDVASRQQNGLLWLEIGELAHDTPDRVRAALAAAPTATGLVLDLRDNGGGLLDSALALAGLFLPPSATVADIIGRDPTDISRHKGSAAPGSPAARLPLVVLVNRGTASGAEIIAAALADNRRALLLGQPTHGLGTLQTVLPIGRDQYLRLTTHQVRRANGLLLVGARVEPDCRAGADEAAMIALLASGAPCPPSHRTLP